MAYAAVNSLLYTIDHLLYANRISFAASTSETLRLAFDRARSLRETLEKFDDTRNHSRGVMVLEARIRDEARTLEDVIECYVSAQFLSQSQTHEGSPPTFSLNLDHLRQDIDCFAEEAQKLEDEYIEELHKPSTQEEDSAPAAAAVVSLGNDFGGNEGEMVGLSDFFLKIRNLLIANESHRTVIAISGMAGIGKTRLAKRVFHDPLIKANFECRAFVRVGRKYQLQELLRAIIAQVNLGSNEMIMKEGENLDEYLERILMGRKYLIVLDDTWDLGFFRVLKFAVPNEDTGSRILVTIRKTRTIEPGERNAYSFTMPLLDEEESWDLLKKKVFGEEEFPRQLLKAGKKIAKNCEGLPLLIIVVAAKILLSEDKNDLEYWNEVAEKKNSVFEDACDQISEVLLLSYKYMRQYLKICFLYIGVFPLSYIVRRIRIVKLWGAEGFIRHGNYAIDKFASYNLVLVCQKCLVRPRLHAFRLHPAYWYMCRREAESNKFFCILNSNADCSVERVTSQRCFAIYNSVLFAIKEVHESLASVATARSVLCTGPYHQYQVPICLDWKLLRVLDALTIRFYEFPDEVVKLIQLTYLALTCDANLPRSISKLWKLSYLIVHRHLSIKWTVDESYVPVEIWDLQELKYLEIIGRNLPNPPPGTVLPNLRKLLDVGAQSCSKDVLESIPNLRKLRLQIELAPDSAQTLSLFDHVSCFQELKSIQCVIVNPEILCEPIVPPPPLSISSESLKKLSLSGSGYPWEDTCKIAELPYLAVLKLRNYAFQGEKWEAKEKEFPNLKYLLIEDTDVVQWTARDGSFPRLRCLTMKNCYNVEEIPLFASDMEVLLSPHIVIELVDCNPLAETCAEQRYGAERVNANYSWK